LDALLAGERTVPRQSDDEVSGASAGGSGVVVSGAEALQTYRIHFKPGAGLMASGTSPAMLLNELRALGECAVVADPGAIPPLARLQADQCYLAWKITLTTGKGLNAIKDVFIFVEDESELSIQAEGAPAPAGPVRTSEPVPLQGTAPSKAEAVAAGQRPGKGQKGRPADGPEGSAPPTAPAPSAPPAESAPAVSRTLTVKNSTVRVPSERLDRLVALVGEMVMNQSRLTQVAACANVPNLNASVEELERLVDELRDNVLGIRMMPIGTTFNRYKRLVHDLSAELGKEIDLVTEGAETELDKTVLDQLGDPLVHLIRNSIDHGIEPMETRQTAGKSRRGTIRLTAAHTGSTVVITIQDDGRGLDLEAIRAKAVEKNLVAPDTAMSREEVFNLIFLPGFSTAKQVTNVSGRGVGMDVVRRQIDALRGSIQLASELGRGATVSLTLPLTLAIIDGLLVGIGQEQFIIPMASVAENVELERGDRARHNGRNLVAVRGELIPYLRLREAFGIAGEDLATEKVVIVRHGCERIGLVVDRVLGSHQTVIQSLGRFYRDIGVVSGATIMGDGRVALILDLPGLVRFAEQENSGGRSAGEGPGRKSGAHHQAETLLNA
jgi:two-component system chemotaxis sensor kinase CheA